MHNLARNKQTVYFKLYTGKSAVVDSDGYKTGEYTTTYGDVQTIRAYVSASRGNASAEQFGIETDYTNTMIVDDTACPIQEDTLLWIGIEPTDASGNAVNHNYIVKQVAKSFNCISYAIKGVKVSG